MSNSKGENNIKRNVKRNVNTIIVLDKMAKNYSKPKLFIPLDKDGNPTIERGADWFVYCYFRNPTTGKMHNTPFKLRKGINRYKTVKERKAFGKKLLIAFTELVESGYTPYEDQITANTQSSVYTVESALKYAYDNKVNALKESTRLDYEDRLNSFLQWCKKTQLNMILVKDFTKAHAVTYLNQHRKQNVSSRTINNHRAALSALFSKLVNDDVIEKNVWLDIKKEQTQPKRNLPFTASQVEQIKKYCNENDPYLYYYICFVALTFLRPREVCRLTIGDINIGECLISVETKTSGTGNKHTLRIIQKLQPILQQMQLQNYPQHFHVFTPDKEPKEWNVLERDKVGYFRKRFTKVRDILKLPKESTIYSFRHTMAVDIYNGLLQSGLTEREAILKMLPITRHTNESGLRNYLREVNAFIAKDWGDKISIDI